MIYFICDEATQLIKIGFTAGDGEARLRDLQTGCPGKLVLLLEMEGSKQEETVWHERFADVRERGEWFSPVPELMLAIMEAKVLKLEAENARLRTDFQAESQRRAMIEAQLRQLICVSQMRNVLDEDP